MISYFPQDQARRTSARYRRTLLRSERLVAYPAPTAHQSTGRYRPSPTSPRKPPEGIAFGARV